MGGVAPKNGSILRIEGVNSALCTGIDHSINQCQENEFSFSGEIHVKFPLYLAISRSHSRETGVHHTVIHQWDCAVSERDGDVPTIGLGTPTERSIADIECIEVPGLTTVRGTDIDDSVDDCRRTNYQRRWGGRRFRAIEI